MHALTAQEALAAWERGQRLDPLGRSLAFLSVALPAVERLRILQLPVGQRDALLLRLRFRTFGPGLRGSVNCPSCNVPLEFAVDLRSYDAIGHLQREIGARELVVEPYRVVFRLPNSEDFSAIAEGCVDAESGREVLLDRCLLHAFEGNQEIAPQQLPAEVLAQVAAEMESLDPLAELPLAIDCGRCDHSSLVLFDIGQFLWHDIAASARSLLEEVHALATAYGWGEEQILNLSGARRRFYIEKIPAGS